MLGHGVIVVPNHTMPCAPGSPTSIRLRDTGGHSSTIPRDVVIRTLVCTTGLPYDFPHTRTRAASSRELPVAIPRMRSWAMLALPCRRNRTPSQGLPLSPGAASCEKRTVRMCHPTPAIVRATDMSLWRWMAIRSPSAPSSISASTSPSVRAAAPHPSAPLPPHRRRQCAAQWHRHSQAAEADGACERPNPHAPSQPRQRRGAGGPSRRRTVHPAQHSLPLAQREPRLPDVVHIIAAHAPDTIEVSQPWQPLPQPAALVRLPGSPAELDHSPSPVALDIRHYLLPQSHVAFFVDVIAITGN